MPDTTPDDLLARSQVAPISGRPIRKDEIELADRGVYVESWLPERRSRRKPLLFVHGELGGSWVWERYLAYFAGRGWEGHALNLRNHHWSQTADPAELSFELFVDDVAAVMRRIGPGVVVVGHGMGGLLALKAAERQPLAGRSSWRRRSRATFACRPTSTSFARSPSSSASRSSAGRRCRNGSSGTIAT
ncbi:MAG: alpha/beta fold hydrolase [Chloroflexi bacterium]|nr:alpha/beta fold hydrolase [Chloroflexota bacterium]